MNKPNFTAAEQQAQRAGRVSAKALAGKRAADHHRGVRHILEQHDEQAQAALEALGAQFTEQSKAAQVSISGLEQERTHLTSRPTDDERHTWFPPGVEYRLWKIQNLLLIVIVLGELVLTKAGLDLLRWNLPETVMAALSLLVIVTTLAHLGGGLLRDQRPVLAGVALGTAVLLHLAFAGLRTLHLMKGHTGLPPLLLFGLLLILGLALTVGTALLGSLKPSKQALLDALEVRLARLKKALEQRLQRHQQHLEEQRRLWAAKKQAFWTGFQQVKSPFLLPHAYHKVLPPTELDTFETDTSESDESRVA